MLLLIDIGNSNITVGFYDNGIRNILRFTTVRKGKGIEGYFPPIKDVMLHHGKEKSDGAVICSVVPEIVPFFIRKLRKNFNLEPLIVSSELKTGLKFCIKNPDELGADRIASAVSAHRLYKGHLIVIDFGTATTFNAISAKGEYRGGAIMPGLKISADALNEKTAKLPEVTLRAPKKILGNDTKSSMLSGLIIGHAGAVERITAEIKHILMKEIKGRTGVRIIATGGLANLVVPYVKGVQEVNPLLTLEGLRIIHELNK